MKKAEKSYRTYSPEFKISVIMDMREHHLSYCEAVRKYLQGVSPTSAIGTLQRWERIYLEEGAEGLMKERRGRGSANGKKRGRPPKLDKQGDKDKYESLKFEIVEVFKKHKGRYGYRRVTDELHKAGYTINHKTVQKLMRELGLKGKQSKNGKYHSYKGTVGKIADNILKRNFNAYKPFEKLATDVTQFNVCNEKVYLSPVLDLFNREIISYSISLSPNLEQIRDMLNGLFNKLPDNARPIFHSDQGWQYKNTEYQRLLAEHNIT